MVLSYPPYEPIISSNLYPTLSLIFLIVGLLFMGYFFTIEATNTGKAASFGNGVNDVISRFIKELGVGLFASFFLGWGILFLCLNVGIYI